MWEIFQEMVSETNKFRIQNFYKLFQFKKNSFIPNWTSIERRLLSISWKKITQSAFPSAGHSLIQKLPSGRLSSETIMIECKEQMRSKDGNKRE